jgi:hypothetical protein
MNAIHTHIDIIKNIYDVCWLMSFELISSELNYLTAFPLPCKWELRMGDYKLNDSRQMQ